MNAMVWMKIKALVQMIGIGGQAWVWRGQAGPFPTKGYPGSRCAKQDIAGAGRLALFPLKGGLSARTGCIDAAQTCAASAHSHWST